MAELRHRVAIRGPLAALCLLVTACEDSTPSRLEIELPAVLRRGLASSDQALCDKLTVDLTFDRTDDLAGPLVDRETLVPRTDVPCTWALAAERQLPGGTYDLVVRFLTREAPGTCSNAQAVAAYVRRDLEFPFPEEFVGLLPSDFFSRPGEEGALLDPQVSFDPDGDGRGSLAEVAQGADPCKPSSVPRPTLTRSGAPTPVIETSTVVLDLASLDADGVAHAVELHIQHGHGPNVGTEEIVLRTWTDARQKEERTTRLPKERWSLRSEADAEAGAGAGRWRVIFVPDEPFIGPLSVHAVVDDGQGNVLARTASSSIDVLNVDDPTRLLFGDAGEEATALRFAEQATPPATHRFRFDDPDLGSDVGTWTPAIRSGPSGLTLNRDGGFWLLSWSPTNAQVVAKAPGGDQLELAFADGGGAPRGQATLRVEISPLWNDPPELIRPPLGELALPSGSFAEHRVHIEVVDPDQTAEAPACEARLAPAQGTACGDAYATLRCEPSGPRVDARWPFVLIFTPSATYPTCGNAPAFDVSLTITDVPPVAAVNGPATTGTGATPLVLRTANVVSAATVSGGPGAVSGFTDPSPPLLHGSTRRALIQVTDPADGRAAVTIVDLTSPAPTFAHRFLRSDLCSLEVNRRPSEAAASDEASARMMVAGRGWDGAGCGTAGAFVVDVTAKTAAFWSNTQLCGASFNSVLGNPVADGLGNFYVTCETSPGRVAKISSAGALTTRTFPTRAESNLEKNLRATVAQEPSGRRWLVWPDDTGLFLVDLSTFDQTSPTVEHHTLDADWSNSTIDDCGADPWRHAYLVAYNRRTAGAQLLRLRFLDGSRALDPPLDLGAIGGNTANGYSYMRLVLRDAGPGSTDPGPDLVVSPGSNSDPRPHVDLDSWSISLVRPVTDYYLGSGSAGISASPDRRFYVAPTFLNFEAGESGIYLYRFDPAVARQFVPLPVPTGGRDWAGRTAMSDLANLLVISEADTDSQISVIYFPDAEAGRD